MNLERAVRIAIGNVAANRFAKTAVVYLAPNLTVRVTRFGRAPRKDDAATDLRIQIGKPNYAARQFIWHALKAGKTFPIKQAQVKLYPQKRSAP